MKPDALDGLVCVCVNDEMAEIMARFVDEMGGCGVAFRSTLKVRQYLTDHDNVDCVVIDLLLAAENGADLIRELHLTRPELACVLVSGFDLETVARENIRGVFLGKPFTPEELAEKILLAIGQSKADRPGPEANG